MFVGHLAVALGAKRSAPNVNLGWLMLGLSLSAAVAMALLQRGQAPVGSTPASPHAPLK